jgi:Toxic anion resistance protein (TelA).
VLEQITALNTTTADIIDSTGKLLKSQTATIHEQAAAATIPSRRCNARSRTSTIRWTRSTRSSSRRSSSMKTTVDTLSNEVEKSKGYIARAEGAAQNSGASAGNQFKLESLAG